MGRHGITYQEVANAANQIQGQGKIPTIEQVRHLLGTGSSTTISNYLRQWKEKQEETQLIPTKENIPPELASLIKGLWEGILELSDKKMQAFEEEQQTFISGLKQNVNKYKTNNQRWQRLFTQWTQKNEQLNNEKGALEQLIQQERLNYADLKAKHALLMQQLLEKQARIEELHNLHHQTQANLEHFRESMREERLLEQQQFAQQKHELQEQIKDYKTHFKYAKDELTALQKAHDVLEKKCEKNVIENTKLINQFEANIKLLKQELEAAKRVAKKIEDQNQRLGHEKGALAEEKATLEGQLKQMLAMVGL